jgi:hypothetical protein
MGLADEVMDALNEFADIEVQTMQDVFLQVGKETAEELKRTSPRMDSSRGGAYAKDWKYKRTTTNRKGASRYADVVIYNAKHYQLTHLLENGHIKVLWGKRTNDTVEPIPHIHQAEKNAIDKVERELKIKL